MSCSCSSYRSIPAGHHCCCWSTGQTDTWPLYDAYHILRRPHDYCDAKKHTTNHKFKLPGTNNCNKEESVFQRWRPWDQGIPIKCIKYINKQQWNFALGEQVYLKHFNWLTGYTDKCKFKLHVLPFSGYCIVVRNLLSRLILWSKKWFLHTNSICAIVSTANRVFTAGTNSWQYLSTDSGLVQ